MMAEQRRKLRFDSLEEVVGDARKSTGGEYQTVGTWTAGQIFEHLATTIDVMLDGSDMKTPFMLRIIGPMMKRFVISRPMKPGIKLPAWAAKHLLPAEVTLEHGLAHLERSCRRLAEATELRIHPIFGNMTKSEAVQLHCRHAELHLSHIVPASKKADC